MKIRLSDAGHLRSTLGNKELGFAMKKKKTKRPSCEDYFRMPLGEEVFDHIRSCESCRALFNQLADDLDRRAYWV